MSIDLAFTGERIRRIRDRLGLTQEAFAYALGVAQANVSNYENDVHQPQKPRTVQRLLELEREAESA